MDSCRPLIVNGEVAPGYYADINGNIWSTRNGSWHRLSPGVGGNTKYPRLSLSINGITKSYYVHRVVCETFHEFPIPAGITDKEWERTPKSVKSLLHRSYQVNHIDHRHDNYHPSNLEWVTVLENSRKYQEHSKKLVKVIERASLQSFMF